MNGFMSGYNCYFFVILWKSHHNYPSLNVNLISVVIDMKVYFITYFQF